jgi:LAO/AO transport system kinase
MVEDGDKRVRSVIKGLKPSPERARVIGLTGAPGAGKSTVASALITAFRARALRTAVLAVDPTSPFSGGALLGDRVRMQEHATDPGVFIRSMGNRGQLGGLAAATPQAVRVLDAAGYQVICVETVGVGQSEVEIASAADTTVVLVAPGMGDSIQAAKAGVLEVADVLVVNKADRPDTQATVRDLRNMIALSSADWKPPIVTTVATSGDGVDELVRQLDRHWAGLADSGERDRRRLARARGEVTARCGGDWRCPTSSRRGWRTAGAIRTRQPMSCSPALACERSGLPQPHVVFRRDGGQVGRVAGVFRRPGGAYRIGERRAELAGRIAS